MSATKISKVYLGLMKTRAGMLAALGKMRPRLLKWPHVVGFGLGPKLKKGFPLRPMVPIFFVDKKIPKHKLKPGDILPSRLWVNGGWVPTDVVRVRPLGLAKSDLGNPRPNNIEERPYHMGTAISVFPEYGPDSIANGTAGAIVKDANGMRYMLSAGHVLLAKHNDVVQPNDKAKNRKKNDPNPPILNQFIGIVNKVVGTDYRVEIDAGMGETSAAGKRIINIGEPNFPTEIIPTLPVQKSGAATGHTKGEVAYVGVEAFNAFKKKIGAVGPFLMAEGLFFIQKEPAYVKGGANQASTLEELMGPLEKIRFSEPGDSGSLIVGGNPDDKEDMGQTLNTLSLIMTEAEKKERRKALDRAALGLLVGNAQLIVTVPKGNGFEDTVYDFTVGQDIQLALDALKVDLA